VTSVQMLSEALNPSAVRWTIRRHSTVATAAEIPPLLSIPRGETPSARPSDASSTSTLTNDDLEQDDAALLPDAIPYAMSPPALRTVDAPTPTSSPHLVEHCPERSPSSSPCSSPGSASWNVQLSEALLSAAPTPLTSPTGSASPLERQVHVKRMRRHSKEGAVPVQLGGSSSPPMSRRVPIRGFCAAMDSLQRRGRNSRASPLPAVDATDLLIMGSFHVSDDSIPGDAL